MNVLRRFFGAGPLLSLALLCAGTSLATAQQDTLSLEALSDGMNVHGFRAVALYMDDNNRPMGGRFQHEKTGFLFDYLRIQSVPQAFMWVNSFPTSDMGEPHTQEHLLLGKGNKGRYVANLEDMSLGGSSAFTMQWRTCYHFNTGAGPEAFYRLFEEQMDALLHPDYTDEEIRREVRNFGVTENPSDKSLRLEEKGTVYNEMVSSFERPWTHLGRALDIAIYGTNHPLSYVSGGLPSAIREMQPEHIRKFHRDHYFLGNMGMVASFPKEMSLTGVLRRTDSILNRVGANTPERSGKIITEETLPFPKGAPAGSFITVEYPSRNENTPAPAVYAWPAQQGLSPDQRLILELFLSNIAGDASTNLYKLFIDTETRKMDLGAQSLFAWVSSDQGNPIFLGFGDVPPANMTEQKMAEAHNLIKQELERISSWEPNSPALKEFNDRLINRIASARREMAKFVNSPPGFGARSSGAGWMTHLDDLAKMGGFHRSLQFRLEDLEKRLATGRNIWKPYIRQWKLIESAPYTVVAKPSPKMAEREEKERQERIAAEVARLKTQYALNDEQEAIRRYGREYDATTAELDRIAAQTPRASFISSPPLTLDDQLDFKESKLAGIPMVASTFDNMSSATVGIAFRLEGIPENELPYLSALPSLLTDVGINEKGKVLSYEEMGEKLRQEILALTAYYSTNFTTGRCELVVRGAGNDRAEAERSVGWMQRVLFSPNWTVENLPRMRDLVDQTLAGLRNTMQGREEAWVHGPAAAYRRQDNPVLLSAQSFLTQTHNVHRLRWMLKDAPTGAGREAIGRFLDDLAPAGSASRENLKSLLAAMKGETSGAVPQDLQRYVESFNALPENARAIALEAAKDLDLTLAEIPDESLPADWSYLCQQMRHDLMVPPSKALDEMNSLRKRMLQTSNARAFMIGSKENQEKLAPAIKKLVAGLGSQKKPAASAGQTRYITERLRERMPNATNPVFVGLVNPNTGSGVFVHSAPNVAYKDTTRDALLNYLTAQVFGGGGSHGIFMKTWGAGLAYSNGIGSSPASGRMSYYAERCPELPQTMRFVIDEIRKAQVDTGLVEYAIAQAFQEVRSPGGYESRGEAMAADLADGTTPKVVTGFRKKILSLRNSPGLAQELFNRREQVYGKVLPGYGPQKKDVPGGVYFTIGPEKQFELYDQYLKAAEGGDARLYRLYPRDFWIPLRTASLEVRSN